MIAVRRLMATTCLLVGLAVATGGCGSGGDETTATGGGEQGQGKGSAAQHGAKQGGEKQAKATGAEKGQAEGGTPTKQSGTQHGGAKPDVATPLHVSGGGSAQVRTKGGDNSIQDFGEESDETELTEAAEALHGFYIARSEEDWQRACSYLAQTVVSELTMMSERAEQANVKGCAGALESLTRKLPLALRRKLTVVDAISLRHEDEHAFLIYYDAEKTTEAVSMVPEDGAWKVGSLGPTPLS